MNVIKLMGAELIFQPLFFNDFLSLMKHIFSQIKKMDQY